MDKLSEHSIRQARRWFYVHKIFLAISVLTPACLIISNNIVAGTPQPWFAIGFLLASTGTAALTAYSLAINKIRLNSFIASLMIQGVQRQINATLDRLNRNAQAQKDSEK